MKFPPVFDDKESGILLAMYEEANRYYDSYALAWKLNAGLKVPSSEAAAAFKGTRDATESLIECGYVRGERFKGADGIYFKELKLIPEGERTATSHRKEVENLKKELPKPIKEANTGVQEMIDSKKK
jgi:hypothetical protein